MNEESSRFLLLLLWQLFVGFFFFSGSCSSASSWVRRLLLLLWQRVLLLRSCGSPASSSSLVVGSSSISDSQSLMRLILNLNQVKLVIARNRGARVRAISVFAFEKAVYFKSLIKGNLGISCAQVDTNARKTYMRLFCYIKLQRGHFLLLPQYFLSKVISNIAVILQKKKLL